LELQQVGGWEMMVFFFYFDAAKNNYEFWESVSCET
jgi:hypothetical protein